MLVTPILQSMLPFDSTITDCSFSFFTNEQVVANELVIEISDTGQEVYRNKINSFAYTHIINRNTLRNGMRYRAKIKVYGLNDEYSQFSETIQFYCFSNPIVEIKNLKSIISASNYEFQGQYFQAENEPLSSYTYKLYDENKMLVTTSDRLLDKLLRHHFSNFEDNHIYYIELVVETFNGLIGTSGLQSFTVDYIRPLLCNLVTLENLYEQASIKVNAHVFSTRGETIDGSEAVFEDNEWIDAIQTPVVYREESGFFSGSSNKTYYFVIKGILENKELIVQKFKMSDVSIKVSYYNNKFHLIKYVNNKAISHYMSNEIIINQFDKVFLHIINENNRYTLQAQLYS